MVYRNRKSNNNLYSSNNNLYSSNNNNNHMYNGKLIEQ